MPTVAERRLGYDPNTSLEEKVSALESRVTLAGVLTSGATSVVLGGMCALQGAPWPWALIVAGLWAPAGYFLGRSFVELQPAFYAMKSGLDGERTVIAMLTQGLPNATVLQNQLIPNKWSRTGHTEIDIVVVSDGVVFLVEVKNNKGTIHASNERNWLVESPGGHTYTMRNPCSQVAGQVKALSRYLRAELGGWLVLPIVVLPENPSVLDAGYSGSIPIFRNNSEQVLRYITEAGLRGGHLQAPPAVVARALNAASAEARKQSRFLLGEGAKTEQTSALNVASKACNKARGAVLASWLAVQCWSGIKTVQCSRWVVRAAKKVSGYCKDKWALLFVWLNSFYPDT